MKTWLITLTVAAALVCGPAQAAGDAKAGDAKAGEAKSAACLACHGPMGNSVVPMWPKLAGQHPEYIHKQLMDFKANNRANEQMTPMAMPLSDQDVADLAAYFASQQQSPGAPGSDAAGLGERLYRGGNAASGVPACAGCHGPQGMGLGLAKFPRISGQHAQYVEQTLKYFRDGARKNDPNGMMRGVAARMTDPEIAAVSQYLQGINQ
jgi:cytochrome c553